MHSVHGVCRRVPGRERPAILIGTEKGSNTGGEMASPRTLTHCRYSSSRLHLPGPGRNSEGIWPLADESATRRLYGSGFSCKRGRSPRHVKSQVQMSNGLHQTARVLVEPVA